MDVAVLSWFSEGEVSVVSCADGGGDGFDFPEDL